jgi:hypothetical protein
VTEKTQTKWKEKRREENNTEGYFKISEREERVGIGIDLGWCCSYARQTKG